MKTLKFGVLLAAALLVSGCGPLEDLFEGGCGPEQDNAKAKRGEPDRVSVFDGGPEWRTETYYWSNAGIAETFVWGSSVSGCDTVVSSI